MPEPAPERTPLDDNAACTLLLDELEDADEYSDDEPVWGDEPVCWAEHTPGNRLRCGLSVDHNGGHYFNTWEGRAVTTPPDDTTRELLREIVFSTRIARIVENESPAQIVQITRDRIWSNLSSYIASGDWPDRHRSAEEVDAEAEAEAAAIARRPPVRPRRGRRKVEERS